MAKLFYSISEVADLLQVNQSLLRFWETEFEGILQPHKNAKGSRFYKEEDIEILKTIHYLVKVQGLTLAGAKKKMKENKNSTVKNQEIYERLQNIRKELLTLRKLLTLPEEDLISELENNQDNED